MNTGTQAAIFFIISSVGFVIVWILVAIFMFYLIKTMHAFSRIADKLERGLNELQDDTRDLIDDVRGSTVFRLLFGTKKKSRARAK